MDHTVPLAQRYAAFGLRMKQLFAVKTKILGVKAKKAALAKARYTAYSSDVGEAFRPVVPEWAVKGTYGLAVAYICGDIGMTTYKESLKPDGNTARTFVHATIFQGVASLALPRAARASASACSPSPGRSATRTLLAPNPGRPLPPVEGLPQRGGWTHEL